MAGINFVKAIMIYLRNKIEDKLEGNKEEIPTFQNRLNKMILGAV